MLPQGETAMFDLSTLVEGLDVPRPKRKRYLHFRFRISPVELKTIREAIERRRSCALANLVGLPVCSLAGDTTTFAALPIRLMTFPTHSALSLPCFGRRPSSI